MSNTVGMPVVRLQEVLNSKDLQGAVLTSAESIRYFSGFTSTDGLVFVGEGHVAVVTDSRYWAQVKSQCPQVELVKYISHEHRNLANALAVWIKENKLGGRLAVEGRSLTLDAYLNLQSELVEGGLVESLVSLSSAIDELRLVKTESELKAIAKAAKAADEAWKKALACFKVGITEADFCAELEYQMQKCGARKPSFDTIVASGLNGAYPHAVVTDKKIEEGELVTVDFGCIVDGWCSDITRTVWIGHLNEEMSRIWSVVKKAHDAGVQGLRPGLTGGQVDKIARDIIAEAGFGPYFSHSLGHGVGLAVHEGPGLRRESTFVLQPHMTATIEPGVYIPEIGGCRIEDLLFLTEDGSKTLSQSPYQIPGQSHPLESFN